MAVPENLGDIRTNLTFERLGQVLQAIDTGQAKQVPGSSSLFADSGGCRFTYQGAEYEYEENYELCTGLFEVTPEYRKAKEKQLGALLGVIGARRESGRGCE